MKSQSRTIVNAPVNPLPLVASTSSGLHSGLPGRFCFREESCRRKKVTGLFTRSGWYWADFTVDGIRYRKPLETKNWQDAVKKKRNLVKEAEVGAVEARSSKKPNKLFAAITAYLEYKAQRCSERTVELEGERLSIVKKHFGDVKLSQITAETIEAYQTNRLNSGKANRTTNMDIGALSRVLKYCGYWKRLQDKVAFLPEGDNDPKGWALTPKEQTSLLKLAASKPEWEHVYCAAMLAANTSMRGVEVKHLRWKTVDLFARTVKVERSKNKNSHRLIPLNDEALSALARMHERAEKLGNAEPDHYIWPACQHGKITPARPQKSWANAWRSLTTKAGLKGLRFHDLRFTCITSLAQKGVPDYVLQSITGHLSRKMLDYYSKIHLDAKREALEKLQQTPTKEAETQPEPALVN